MLLRKLEPEKYWSFPSSYTREKRDFEIEAMISSGRYYYQLKTDGHYSAFICDTDGEKSLISRGVSKVNGEYTRLEDKVFFFDAIAAVFNKPTRIMAEVWLEGAVDKNIGSIIRCSAPKAKSIQDYEYYKQISQSVRFTAKDKRDIERNEFHNQKLCWRIFDIWYFDGEDLTSMPWIERQEYVRRAAERINHPLVSYVPYYPMDSSFYDKLAEIFENGGEGVVCYREDGKPEPGKRTAHKTCKIKREVSHDLDLLIIGIVPPTHDYTGKDIGKWQFWRNTRTGEKLIGEYFTEYQLGGSYEPITKNFYYNYPGALIAGAYNNKKELVPICNVSGLTDDLRIELRDNFDKMYLCPIKVGGMALSDSNGLSVRHPHLISIRETDISPDDCTVEKIIGG